MCLVCQWKTRDVCSLQCSFWNVQQHKHTSNAAAVIFSIFSAPIERTLCQTMCILAFKRKSDLWETTVISNSPSVLQGPASEGPAVCDPSCFMHKTLFLHGPNVTTQLNIWMYLWMNHFIALNRDHQGKLEFQEMKETSDLRSAFKRRPSVMGRAYAILLNC